MSEHLEHHHEEEVEYVYIPDDEGNEARFEVLYKFEVDDTGKSYMLVLPADEAGAEGEEEEPLEVLAFRYEENGEDGYTLYTIDDPEEWEMVEEVFHTFMEADEDEE